MDALAEDAGFVTSRTRRWKRPRLRLLAAVLVLVSPSACASAAAPQVRIAGNHFVDRSGHILRLIGVDAGPDLSDACVQPTYGDPYRAGGVWGGPVDSRAVAAIAHWHVGAVRISLNEDCWLGINPVRRTVSAITIVRRGAGALGRLIALHYRSQVRAYVRRLHARGMAVIIDLHWSAPGRTLAFDQFPMPDRDHSPAFWRSVARTFAGDSDIVFDIFNEPFESDPSRLSWSCLRDGCRLPDGCADCSSAPPGCTACPTADHPAGTYRAAGMQALVDGIRSTGARQPIIAPGLSYTNDLSRWWSFRPRDPLHQLGVSFHAYEGEACANPGCWERVVAPLARRVPVVVGEFGPSLQDQQGRRLSEPCDERCDQSLMGWADAHGVSYLAWAWYYDNLVSDNAQRPYCSQNLLDVDWYSGIPRPGHGQAVHDHLAALSRAEGVGILR